MNMDKTTSFFTKDLYLGAYIFSQDVKLLEVQKDPTNNYLWFVFDNSNRCKELENQFWSKSANVELTTYLNALKTLKQRLFQYYPKGG